MKRIVASVSLVALGAASVQAQSAPPGQNPSVSGPGAKWWSISATVRGFYDDNANTAPNGAFKINTWGYDLSPSVGVNGGNQQTAYSASYTFDYIYYARPLSSSVTNTLGQAGPVTHNDQDHTFNAALDHAFSERYAIHVGDSFVIGQQPDALRPGNAVVAFYRIPGNNIVNSGTIRFNAELTPLLGLEAGYNNALYDYEAQELSGPLNRIENYGHLDLRMSVAKETVGVLGFQFGDVDYTGSGPFANAFGVDSRPFATNGLPAPQAVNVLDSRSYTGYIGVDHTFLPNLVGSIRAGASYYDYYNDTNSASGFGPYAQVSLNYTYAPESTIGIGFQEGRQASSLTGAQFSQIVHDTETSVLYGSVVHRIMPKLFGSLRGTFQNSTYNGGGQGINGLSDRFYEVEADLEYRFLPNFSVHGGYDYTELDSGLTALGNRSYDRNRFYIGATASY